MNNFKEENSKYIAGIVAGRDNLFRTLKAFEESWSYEVKPSAGNFLLLRFRDHEKFMEAKQKLDSDRIQVLDVSNTPGLGDSLRVTIGNSSENEAFLKIFSNH